MYKYLVKFAHEDDTQTDESKRHGAGQIEIETDELVTSQEHLVEIARSIGKKNNYTKVGITDLVQMIEEDDK